MDRKDVFFRIEIGDSPGDFYGPDIDSLLSPTINIKFDKLVTVYAQDGILPSRLSKRLKVLCGVFIVENSLFVANFVRIYNKSCMVKSISKS
jgi:hypothetical protein